MFWYVMRMLFSPLYLMFGLVCRGEQARLVLALHHQVLVLQRQWGKRPTLPSSERLALVLSGLLLGTEKLRRALLIVRPDTVVGWHRAILRRHRRLLARRKPGRPPRSARRWRSGWKVIRLPARSPDLNGYAERWIRSLRQECLDHIILLNEAHLCWVLTEYIRYYNQRQPHQSLRHLPPEAPDAYPREGRIAARPVLGGLISDYHRLAA